MSEKWMCDHCRGWNYSPRDEGCQDCARSTSRAGVKDWDWTTPQSAIKSAWITMYGGFWLLVFVVGGLEFTTNLLLHIDRIGWLIILGITAIVWCTHSQGAFAQSMRRDIARWGRVQ